jgi:hypothetical protein
MSIKITVDGNKTTINGENMTTDEFGIVSKSLSSASQALCKVFGVPDDIVINGKTNIVPEILDRKAHVGVDYAVPGSDETVTTVITRESNEPDFYLVTGEVGQMLCSWLIKLPSQLDTRFNYSVSHREMTAIRFVVEQEPAAKNIGILKLDVESYKPILIANHEIIRE